MKKLFVAVTTPFWMLNYHENINIALFAKTDPVFLSQDCDNFSKLAMQKVDPEEYKFKRELPLGGSGKNDYEMNFIIEEHEEIQIGEDGKESSVLVDSASLKDFSLIAEPGSLTEISRSLGLPDAKISLQQSGDEITLNVRGREQVCDLLNKKVKLLARARLRVGPTREAILQLNNKLTQIENTISDVKTLEKNNNVAAALLGYRLKKEEIEMVFEKLFQKNSLEPSDIWEDFAGHPIIRFEKSKLTDFAVVNLSLNLAVP